MPRLDRPHFLNQYYHIFNRGFDRKELFLSSSDYLRFLGKLEESTSKFDWLVYSTFIFKSKLETTRSESSSIGSKHPTRFTLIKNINILVPYSPIVSNPYSFKKKPTTSVFPNTFI